MKIVIVHVGRTSDKGLKSFIEEFVKRTDRFAQVKVEVVDSFKGKNLAPIEIMKIEQRNILEKVMDGDRLILLDEKGTSYSSRGFAKMIEEYFLHHSKRMVFVIGGAYGFGEELKKKSSASVSLSSMTFNHELALAVFAEQIYRALTIIKGHPYHND